VQLLGGQSEELVHGSIPPSFFGRQKDQMVCRREDGRREGWPFINDIGGHDMVWMDLKCKMRLNEMDSHSSELFEYIYKGIVTESVRFSNLHGASAGRLPYFLMP
jgi:hypothetical protein